MLGDDAVDAAIAALREQLARLTQAEGAVPKAALDKHLTRLIEADLIRLYESLPEHSYLFKHALVQEAAYQSLLRHERMEIHRRVADCTARLNAARLADVAPLLAFHYSEAGDDERALDYALLAAEHGVRRFAFPEAALHYARAIDALTRLPDTPQLRARRVDSITRYVELSWGTNRPSDQLALLAEAEQLARTLRGSTGSDVDARRLAQIRSMMAAMHLAANNLRQAEPLARAVIAEAEALRETALAITSYAQLGALHVVQGRFDEAVPFLDQVLGWLGDAVERWEWAWSLGFRAIALAMQGQTAEGIAEARRALARMKTTANHVGIVQARSYLLAVYLAAGDCEALLAESRLAETSARQWAYPLYIAIALNYQALALSRLGNHAEAHHCANNARALAAHIGGSYLQSDWFAAAQAEIAANAEQYQEAIELAEQAKEQAQATGSDFARGWAERVLGVALATLHPERRAEADVHLAESLRLFDACGAPLEAEHTRAAISHV